MMSSNILRKILKLFTQVELNDLVRDLGLIKKGKGKKFKITSSFTRLKHIMYLIEEKCETANTPGGHTCTVT